MNPLRDDLELEHNDSRVLRIDPLSHRNYAEKYLSHESTDMPTFWKKDTVWNKKPKAKKPPNPEDKAWVAFSLYIRTRDALRTTGSTLAAKCVTCPKISTTKGNDAGHFITRGASAIKYNPRNCHYQCTTCNRFQQGRWDAYMDFMRSFYGMGVVEELLSARNLP
jgi:hypothetical protein